MAGNITHMDKCSKGIVNDQFHMEMCNVASMEDTFGSSTQEESPRGEVKDGTARLRDDTLKHLQVYTQADANSHGSVLSLKQRSDTEPLTEWHACRYEECIKFHSPSQSDPESPASPLKNAFFYLTILLLVAWVLVYTILSKMNYL